MDDDFDGMLDGFMQPQRLIDDDDVDEDGVTDRLDKRYDISRSRWVFLGRYFYDWLSAAEFENLDTSSYMAVRFDCFNVSVPAIPASDAYLRRQRDATELVACMFRVDVAAWQFMKKVGRFAFQHFQVSNYDPKELEPKMKFVLIPPGDEIQGPEAIQRLRFMLLECNRDADARGNRPDDIDSANFFKNRAMIHELDTENRLRGWKIPIAILFSSPDPTEATGVEPVRVYLREAITMIRDLLAKDEDETSPFAFRLVEVELRLLTTRVSDVMDELRELKSLGVAVKIALRHSHRDPFRIDWSQLGPRDNVYPLLADGAGSRHDDERDAASVSFRQLSILSSNQLLSAVASASTLKSLMLVLPIVTQFDAAMTQAKWLAYALRMSRGLRVLELSGLLVTNETLDAMQAAVDATNPARLLGDHDDLTATVTDLPQFVLLKPGALVSADNGEPRTLTQLNIPPDWEFAVVNSQTEPASIRFVVPGYGICSTSPQDIATIRSLDEPYEPTAQSQLTTLVLDGPRPLQAPVSRFLQLFGQSLKELRWSMSGNQPLARDELERDLASILTTSSQLKSFSLENSELSSLTLFTQRFQSSDCHLRSLVFLDVNIPQHALLDFFASVGDPTTKIAQNLEKLYMYAPDRPLNAEVAEAVLQMLTTNRRLRHLALCVTDRVFTSYKQRFKASEEAVQVRSAPLPLDKKLAFLSAQRRPSHGNAALGRLDAMCLALVFDFAAVSERRRIQFFSEDY